MLQAEWRAAGREAEAAHAEDELPGDDGGAVAIVCGEEVQLQVGCAAAASATRR